MPTADEYRKRAIELYDPSYNAKVTSLNNSQNTQLTALDSQKGTVNQNFQQQEDDQNRSNAIDKVNYDNINTSRGLGRSTILTTGLASMDQKNDRLINQIKTSKNNALNAIEGEKTTLISNTQNSLNQLAGDRESALSALIQQFQKDDEAKAERDRAYQLQVDQFNFQKQQAAQNAELERQKLAASIQAARSRSSGSSSSSSKAKTTADKNAAWDAFYESLDDGMADSFLKKNRSAIINNIGADEYDKMYKKTRERYAAADKVMGIDKSAQQEHAREYNRKPQNYLD